MPRANCVSHWFDSGTIQILDMTDVKPIWPLHLVTGNILARAELSYSRSPSRAAEQPIRKNGQMVRGKYLRVNLLM